MTKLSVSGSQDWDSAAGSATEHPNWWEIKIKTIRITPVGPICVNNDYAFIFLIASPYSGRDGALEAHKETI